MTTCFEDSEQTSRRDFSSIIVVLLFTLGIFGNSVALKILFSPARPRNSKHVLMLRCLAINDLIALVGMFATRLLDEQKAIPVYWTCVLYVMLRAFGLGSGCIAFVMAMERWLALTRPFLYQQIVTYQLLMKIICALWGLAALLTYLPLFKFGIFHNADRDVCCRYRDGRQVKDVIYAYVFCVFATLLCISIVMCNTSVLWELARMGNPQGKFIRRISKTMINSIKPQYSTNEELAFAKLMAVLCAIFIVCWMPDMISVPWAQKLEYHSRGFDIFCKIGDLLKLILFVVNPFVYVIYQYFSRKKSKLPKRNTINAGPSQASDLVSTPTSILLMEPCFSGNQSK